MSRMSGLNWSLKTYIAAVTALGVAAIVLNLAFFPTQLTPARLALTAAFAALVGLAGVYAIPLSPRVKTNVTTAAVFAAVLVLPPGMATAGAVVGMAISESLLKRSWHQVCFNSAVTSLYVAGASAVFHILNPFRDLLFDSAVSLAGLVAAAAVIYAVNRAAVATAVGLDLGKNPLSLWRQTWKEDIFQEVTLLVLGFLAALAVSQVPWTIGLFVIPVGIVYRAFSKIMELNRKVEAQMAELKAAQGQLVETAKMAAIGTLAAGVAHQVNNPIFAIRGRAELLLADPERHLKTEKAKQSLDVIYQMSGRVSRIVNSLLVSSRPSEDGINCCDVHEAMESVLALLEDRLKKSSIHVVQEFGPSLPLVSGDGTEIQELFMNLAINSCDAMPNGGELRLTTHARDSAVAVEITDTGCGIPAENLGRLFDPFFTTKEVGKGIGLGLFVVREIIQRHGGSISVESEPGKGTKFMVSLPVPGDSGECSRPAEAAYAGRRVPAFQW